MRRLFGVCGPVSCERRRLSCSTRSLVASTCTVCAQWWHDMHPLTTVCDALARVPTDGILHYGHPMQAFSDVEPKHMCPLHWKGH